MADGWAVCESESVNRPTEKENGPEEKRKRPGRKKNSAQKENPEKENF